MLVKMRRYARTLSREKEKMTCKDCKYFDKTIHMIVDEMEIHRCNLEVNYTHLSVTTPIAKPCIAFEPKEDSWESVSK